LRILLGVFSKYIEFSLDELKSCNVKFSDDLETGDGRNRSAMSRNRTIVAGNKLTQALPQIAQAGIRHHAK
jgi:hypothetical protein